MSTASITQLNNYLNMPEVQALLQDIAVPESNVHQWLARLMLLSDIPFQNIVADTRLLPSESLRFFYVDPSWLDAMIDGALSIGNDTSLDLMFTQVMADTVKYASAATAASIRTQLLGIEAENGTLPDPSKLMSGLLLRSAIVTNWPSLHIIPTYADPTVSLTPVRFDRIGPDMILVIFPSVPQSIVIQQPSHALVFGVMDDASNPLSFDIYLRGLGNGGYATGAVIPSGAKDLTVSFTANDPAFFRAGGNNVLGISQILSKVQGAFPSGALSGGLTPSQFAIQLVKTPEEITFTN